MCATKYNVKQILSQKQLSYHNRNVAITRLRKIIEGIPHYHYAYTHDIPDDVWQEMYNTVYSYIFRRINHFDISHDLTQETLSVIYQKDTDIDNLLGYATQIAKHTTKHYCKKDHPLKTTRYTQNTERLCGSTCRIFSDCYYCHF